MRPFSALYRLTCCGQRGLPTVVRGDGRVLAISVAVPPGGVAWEAWLDDGAAWMYRPGRPCRVALPPGEMPVAADVRVPLAPDLAGYLLAGRLPPDATVSAADPGWVTATVGPWRLRARVVGEPPRWVAAELTGAARGGEVASFSFDEPRGPVPGRVRIRAGDQDVLLQLVQWRTGEPPPRPSWLTLPTCPSGAEAP